MDYIRTHIRLDTMKDVHRLVDMCTSSSFCNDVLMLETSNSMHRVSATSILGVMYMSAEHSDDIYFVNLTRNGIFPVDIRNLMV